MSRLYTFLLIAMTLVMASCDVHEMPVIADSDVDVILDLQYDLSMPLYKELTYTRDPAGVEETRASILSHDVRFIVNVYPAGTTAETRSANAPVRQFVFTDRSDLPLDRRLNLALPPGAWDIYVWTDFVDNNATADRYYITDRFDSISLPEPSNYDAANECRQCFRGMTSIVARHPETVDETNITLSATIEMQRPLTRFEFISTDVEDFVRRIPELVGRGNSRSFDDDPVNSRALTRNDLSDFRVVLRYTAFTPSVYNIFTDKLTDSRTGMSSSSFMDICEDGILLGFDYLLINNEESIANIAVEVYNSDNRLIASSPSIEVPVVRNKCTILKSEFLSSISSGGVTVNPEFDGEYNIEIE